MKHFKKFFGPWVFTVALIALLMGTGSAGAISATHLRVANCTSGIVPSPNPGSLNILRGITYVSENNVWAAGSYVNGQTNLADTLIEHWNGLQWSLVSSPNVGSANNYLYGISADSANDIWAVGYDSTGYTQSIIEHWDGSQWSLIPHPNPGTGFNYLNGVDAISSYNVWFVGEEINKSQTQDDILIEHWDGTQWTVYTSPDPGAAENALDSVAAVSPNDIWTVGNYSNTNDHNLTLTEHWNGSSWSWVNSPSVGSFANFLRGVATVSTNDVWAVGFYWASPGDITDTLTENWNGSGWNVIPSPNPPGGDNFLGGVFALNATNVYAVGSSVSGTLVIKWNGTAWVIIPSFNVSDASNSLLAISGPPPNGASGNSLWAAGFYVNNQNNAENTLIERFCL
ncbi:MAG TPA: hypothetical protein VFA09_05095 [Ktedonobacteraceae bacterium]|nr:hypothetical protein [Ktedonobacteraceae bacterium]